MGGLSWSKLAHPWQVGEYRPAHVRLLHELYALYTSRAGAPRYPGYGEEKVIDLAEIDSWHLWSLLDEAADLGLRIVHARKVLGDVARHGTARVALDVTGGDPLVVAPQLLLDPGRDKLPADPVPVRFIGACGHGVVWVSVGQAAKSEPGLWRFGLARLAAPVPAALQQLALAGRQLTVPAAGRARFDVEIYPRLRALATVESSDGAWSPPPISAPTLALRAAYGPDHALDLTWEWHYEVGGRTLRSPLAATGDGHRDPAAERAALAALDAPLEAVGLRADGELVPQAHLGGLQTMRFTTEVLPLLADASGVRVECHGHRPTYRDAGDSLRIAVSADRARRRHRLVRPRRQVRSRAGTSRSPSCSWRCAAASRTCCSPTAPTSPSTSRSCGRCASSSRRRGRCRTPPPGGPADQPASRPGCGRSWPRWASSSGRPRRGSEQVQGLLSTDARPRTPAVPARPAARTCGPTSARGFRGCSSCGRPGSAASSPTTWASARPCRRWRCSCHARSTDPDGPPFLVVAPTSVLPNWAAEAAGSPRT